MRRVKAWIEPMTYTNKEIHDKAAEMRKTGAKGKDIAKFFGIPWKALLVRLELAKNGVEFDTGDPVWKTPCYVSTEIKPDTYM